MEENGVNRALRAAGNGDITPESFKKIADLLGDVSVEFIYNAKRKGYFPPERARVIADAYGIPLIDLVSPKNRALLQTR